MPLGTPLPFHAGVLVAGPLLRGLVGEAAPTLGSPGWVRESGQPGKTTEEHLQSSLLVN